LSLEHKKKLIRDGILHIASGPGVVILGMHRSGTSMLGGLICKMGFNTGTLMAGAKDNPKGYFERFDVAQQNDFI